MPIVNPTGTRAPEGVSNSLGCTETIPPTNTNRSLGDKQRLPTVADTDACWIAAAGIQLIHIVEKRMLCNESAANLRDGNCWEVLMSSFVFVFWQNPGLR